MICPEFSKYFSEVVLKKLITSAELQGRGAIEDNSKIICLISERKLIL